jgi:hypothetical protein
LNVIDKHLLMRRLSGNRYYLDGRNRVFPPRFQHPIEKTLGALLSVCFVAASRGIAQLLILLLKNNGHSFRWPRRNRLARRNFQAL